MFCRISNSSICGLETVALENDLVRALIIAGKGADLLEYVWKPTGANCFHRSNIPFEAYSSRDLKKERLASHTEMGLGGWMTVLPHRARYKDIELTQETGGIGATVPWEYIVVENSDVTVSVKFCTDLPVIPMRIEKVFTLADGSASLTIDETVNFHGDEPVEFTWTEHAMFGGDFVDEDTVVCLPSERAFDAWAHMAAPDKPLDSFINPASAFPLKGGAKNSTLFDLRRPLPTSYNGSEFIVFDKLKEGRAGLHNAKSGLSISLSWDKALFPYMRSLYQSGDSIIIGLEPGDDMFSGFEHSLKRGTYTKLLPGENITTSFCLAYHKTEQ